MRRVLTRRLREEAKQTLRSGVVDDRRRPRRAAARRDVRGARHARSRGRSVTPGATVSTLDDARNASTAACVDRPQHDCAAAPTSFARSDGRPPARRARDARARARGRTRLRPLARSRRPRPRRARRRVGATRPRGGGRRAERGRGRARPEPGHRIRASPRPERRSRSSCRDRGSTTPRRSSARCRLARAAARRDGLVLSAGITELAEDDDADAGLGRAEHALWQAKQAGAGTIVVAVPNRRPRRPAERNPSPSASTLGSTVSGGVPRSRLHPPFV